MEDSEKGGNSVPQQQETEPTFKAADIQNTKAGQSDVQMNVHETRANKFKKFSAKIGQWVQQHYKRIFIIVVSVSIVAVGVFVGICIIPKLLISNNSQDSNDTQQEVTVSAQSSNDAAISTIREECKPYFADENNMEKGIACWQNYINTNESANGERKADLYKGRADQLLNFYSQHQDLASQIINDLKAADAAYPTSQSAYAVYDFFRYSGDTEQAAEWQTTLQNRLQEELKNTPTPPGVQTGGQG